MIGAVTRSRNGCEKPELLGELLLAGHSLASAATCSSILADDSIWAVVGDGGYRFDARWKPKAIEVYWENDENIGIITVPFPADPVGGYWLPEWGIPPHLNSAVLESDVPIRPIERDGDEILLYFDGEVYWSNDHDYYFCYLVS